MQKEETKVRTAANREKKKALMIIARDPMTILDELLIHEDCGFVSATRRKIYYIFIRDIGENISRVRIQACLKFLDNFEMTILNGHVCSKLFPKNLTFHWSRKSVHQNSTGTRFLFRKLSRQKKMQEDEMQKDIAIFFCAIPFELKRFAEICRVFLKQFI